MDKRLRHELITWGIFVIAVLLVGFSIEKLAETLPIPQWLILLGAFLFGILLMLGVEWFVTKVLKKIIINTMKKTIFILFAITLISCSEGPKEKYDVAKHCLDSLKDNGAQNSIKYYDLLDNMKFAEGQIESENSKLFKKYDDVNKGLDEIINTARTFVITNDRPDAIEKARRGIPNDPIQAELNNIKTKVINPNVVRLEVELTFDNEQDALKVASQVDESIRRNIMNAKLISVKIIE